MTFAHPSVLGLALVVLAAAWWRLRRLENSRAAFRFPGAPELWSRAPTTPERLARWAAPLLKASALLLLVAGLARPQRVSSRLGGLGRGIDIMMALDVSLSMGALDFAPSSRLDAAKDTARRFIDGRASDRIGAVIFAGATQLACPLTADYEALKSQIEALSPGMTRADGTAIGDGIVAALNRLKTSSAKSRIVILLTDGRSNMGAIDPLTAAGTAASLGVKIYAIGTAKRGQALMPIEDPVRGRMMVAIDDDLDEDLLTEVARLTEGRYFRATSLKELRGIYDTIDRLEKSEMKLPDIVSRADLYHYPLIAAALLLLLEAALSNTWLLRWP